VVLRAWRTPKISELASEQHFSQLKSVTPIMARFPLLERGVMLVIEHFYRTVVMSDDSVPHDYSRQDEEGSREFENLGSKLTTHHFLVGLSYRF